MSLFRKKKENEKYEDFVSPRQEKREAFEESVKELLDGRILADNVIRKNIGFILFLTLIGILYIANGYHMEKLHVRKVEMERKLVEMRFESITRASELMKISSLSNVLRRVHDSGLALEESKEPPVKIYRK